MTGALAGDSDLLKTVEDLVTLPHELRAVVTRLTRDLTNVSSSTIV
jgi:hypothetical protein